LSHVLPDLNSQLVRTVSSVGLLGLTGSDSRRFLHGQTTQHFTSTPAGQLRRSCAVTATGRLVALLDVLVEKDGAQVVVLAGDDLALQQSFDRHLFPADQVTLLPLAQMQQVSLLGKTATALLAAQGIMVQPSGVDWCPIQWGEGEGQAVLLRGTEFGDMVPGWRLLVPHELPLPPWLQTCPQLSAPQRELLRLQQGLPKAPGELNGAFNPFELGLAPAVALNKGCYLGQEVLARLMTYDGVKQQLRFWQSPTALENLPHGPKSEVIQGEDGTRAGVVTSRTALGTGSVGLAVVRRAWLEATNLKLGDAPLSLSLPAAAQFSCSP